MTHWTLGAVFGAAYLACTGLVSGGDVVSSADVYVLGEIHDNPAHHAYQADFLRDVQPRAVVFEMLTPEEAAQLEDVPRTSGAIQAVIQGFHWNNINDYVAVLEASPVIIGAALPRQDVRRAFSDGAAMVFSGEPDAFALSEDLHPDEKDTRMQMQFTAHCETMPLDMMGGMVEAQRLRDATFAKAVIDAVDTHGAPVVLITGNGHARVDWGVPFYLGNTRPDLVVFAIGQSEGGQISGTFDVVLDSDQLTRPDPCLAFK